MFQLDLPHQLFEIQKYFITPRAKRLNVTNRNHIIETAKIIKQGGIVAFPFNGIYGLFGDADNKKAADKINRAKNRPSDKNLIIVSDPDYIHEQVDFSNVSFTQEMINNIWRNIHALGIILPAAMTAPSHLIPNKTQPQILSIWTEYEPLKQLLAEFRKLGGRALVGTSANKSGQPTHYQAKTLWLDFEKNVNAIIEADFKGIHPDRRKSTSVIDLTTEFPKFHRLGNVSEKEINAVLKKFGFKDIVQKNDLIIVKARD